MSKNEIIKRGFMNALGVVAYTVAFAWIINCFHNWFGSAPIGWLGIALFLVLFIISACVTGALVLLSPVLLYMEGHKKDAMHLFAYTLVFLAILAVVIGFIASRMY